ncbi:MAG: response regulator [Caulobacterales bacterium]|nr:response regulator [Caulobacterales bacterium]
MSARKTAGTGDGPFSIDVNVELVLVGTPGRLVYAGFFAALALLIGPWGFCATWLGLILAWELVVRPRLDGVVQQLPGERAMLAYAGVNFVGSCLFATMGLMGLAAGTPIGLALGAVWLCGSFVNIFVYFGGDRRVLTACLIPACSATIAGPIVAYGLQPQAGAISVLIFMGLASARGYALDRRALSQSLADRQVAISEIERKLEVAIEASGDGLFELDLVRSDIRVSETWAAMLGYAADEVSGLIGDWRGLVYPDDLPLLDAAYADHFAGKTPHTAVEHRMLCKDGSTKWILARGRLVERTASGRPKRIVGTTMDLTLRKALEQQLEAARDAAEAANQAKSAFLANMSHEIRTPLNGVIGTAGALARRPLATEEREMVGLIQSSGQILDRLLSDILDQAKIEAGRFELATAPFDLRHEIETAAELMRARADERGVAFRVSYGEAARGMFAGDAVRLRQIVSNLASNAIKFTSAGEVRIAVEVEPSAEADGLPVLRIDVSDTGIGIDAEAALRLFARFTQADGSISRQFGGTGLGLAICKALVELMDGEIAARSEPGVGSTFTVRLPLARTLPLADYDRQAAGAVGEAADTVADDEAMGPLRVLLAEDHPTNQRVVQLILEPAGVELTIVGNGAEAVEAFRPGLFDLILMDMQMPVMDGLAATAEIRRRERELGVAAMPIAMLTANAMREHAEAAAAAGADHLIAKPVTPESLVEGIQTTLVKAAEAASAYPQAEAG